MKCCKKKHHKRSEIHHSEIVENCVSEESRKDYERWSQVKTQATSGGVRNAWAFTDRPYHVVMSDYADSEGDDVRVCLKYMDRKGHDTGSWKPYDPTAFQMMKINIARATTGKIHLMMHRKSGFIGIMKVLPPAKSAEARAELNALSLCNTSPFFIRLLDGYQLDNFFIFLEYAPFKTLDHLTQAVKGVGSENTKLYALELTCALDFLHSKNIMHRDVKPENAFILLSGHVALGDLGSSIRMDGNTVTSRKCGTYVTRPPEVWNGENYTMAVDIWELGMTIYNVISNMWPIAHANKDMQIQGITKGKIIYGQSFTKDASDFIGRLLQVDPNLRPTASQILKHRYLADVSEPYAPAFTPNELVEMLNFGDEGKLIRELVGQLYS